MSRHSNNHIRDSKPQFSNLKEITYSVDIKKFSRDRGNMTPSHHNTTNIYKRLQERSYEKVRNSQPTSISGPFIKNVSQKIIPTKRKLSSGFQIIKTNHHSVSIDQHLLKEKYNLIKELFQSKQFEKIIPLIKHIIFHFQYSNAQKNLYYWLATALTYCHRLQEALQEIQECITQYPGFQQAFLLIGQIHFRLKNYKLAAQKLHEAIKINPKNSQPYLHLALCYSEMKQNEQLRMHLLNSLQKFPKEGLFLMFLVQNLLSLDMIPKCDQLIKTFELNFNRRDSIFLYIRGLVQKKKGNQNQAYILFEQSLKFNNNKIGVNKALLQVIKIEIERRDFYKAHHSVSRIKFLDLEQTEEIKVYAIMIQGVMTMMKKKSQEAIDILLKIVANKRCTELNIQSLIYKYLAYGYFKISDFAKSIKFYGKLNKNEVDQSSLYNKLLAQGIQLADKHKNYVESIKKFNSAKSVYPQKVQPYIYIAMVHITRYNSKNVQDQVKKAQALIDGLKEMELGNKLNPNSSNLLYHRTIIHLYFQDWDQALDDINRCIEKAEQNLPKYFYLRGVCYSCIKDFKKAINEFSICLSLDANCYQAHLQKAKCYFLLGNTQKGFNSLKLSMQLNPNDLSIYKWIGDLLYQGMSYRDALKAYSQMKSEDDLQTAIMKGKCLFRVGSMNEVGQMLKNIQKQENVQKSKINLDVTAFTLITALLKGENNKVISSLIKKLNKLLQENVLGYVFLLIDCMNLLGVASFYLEKYNDAYQSFLLVLQLYQSLCQKETVTLRSEQSQGDLDLRSQDIYFNLIVCQLAVGNTNQAMKMINNEYLNIVTDPKQKRKIQKLLAHIKSQSIQSFEWDFKNDKPCNYKFKKVEISTTTNLKLKTKPIFNLYHDSASNLYASQVAETMVNKLHAGYIDNMPEGPWIKRNPFGVVFTEDVMPSENSISLQETFREKESRLNSSFEEESVRVSQQQSCKKTVSKKEQFLKKIRFDEALEAKLNNMILKSQNEVKKPSQI